MQPGAVAFCLAGGLLLSIVQAAPAVSPSVFPTNAEVRDITGLSGRRYGIPAHNVMEGVHVYRRGRCTPRFARKAVEVRAMDYPRVRTSKPYGTSVKVFVWEYRGAGVARRSVDGYRRQMAGCRSYRLYVKKRPSDPGFPIRTFGVNGRPGQARMRHKFGSSVDTAEREWVTAVGRFAVEVEVDNWGLPRPKFPSKRIPHDVTALVVERLSDLADGQKLSATSKAAAEPRVGGRR